MAQYIYGRNVVFTRIKEDKDIEELYLLETIKDKSLFELAKKKNINVIITKKAKLESLVNNGFHQGVVAKVKTYEYSDFDESLEELKNSYNSLVVVLDGLEDPHNLGAILRSCEATGVDLVVIPKHNACSLNSTVAKTSAGAIELVKVAEVTNLKDAIKKMKEKGFWIVGAEANNSTDYRKVDYSTKIALVVGKEGKGISRLVLENCDFKVSLPMVGKINSLNVSVACAVLLYQIYNNRFPI